MRRLLLAATTALTVTIAAPVAVAVVWWLFVSPKAAVDAPRLLTVPAGATVVATGRRHGDWWQVTAIIEGRECSGWASSLWLRRSDEPARPE